MSDSTETGRRRDVSRTRAGGRSRLGAGLVQIAPVPFRDPSAAVLVNPSVPESRRFCNHCEEPVGRGREGAPGRATGFCRNCGAPFSFAPKLRPNEVVADQYEIVGCLAHGGMGWLYLARDNNVSGRWVVLKGLLDAADSDATAAALAERRFLAQVEHPNIVKIFNFVQHESSGYIVMEYVGGRSLKQLLTARRELGGRKAAPLPPAEAIAYVLEILPAFGYLHELGLLFCDFKLDNVIQTQHSLTLVDLGGVHRMDEPASAVFGTVGYEAPEIASVGPSVSSDLFTIARTLAILCIDFRDFQTTYRFTLPPQELVPVFERHDSLYRFLLKGTAPDPDDRFRDAEEMAEQLYGVLREVVAVQEGRPVPAPSTLFAGGMVANLERPDWGILPRPQVGSDDPSAGYLAALTATDPRQMIAQLRAAPERSTEVDLRLAAAMIETSDLDGAESVLARVQADDPWEWRVGWYRGIAELARDAPQQATARFMAVYHALPGELAPKLALGLACELASNETEATRWYGIVATTDPSITTASFGLARCHLRTGDRLGAITAYERVPDTSSGYIDAQAALIRCLSARNGTGAPTIDELMQAAARLEALPVDGEQRERLTVELLDAALQLATSGAIGDERDGRLLGHRLSERELRVGLERSYRSLARRTPSRAERIRLVDAANRTRPRTWT